MSDQKHFVKTSSPETAKALRLEGLTELSMEGKFFVFVNDWSKKNFSEDVDQRTLIYSNKINI